MDNQIKTSFIPRKPLQTSANVKASSLHTSNRSMLSSVFSLVSTGIFLLACIGFGGTFVWEKQLNSKIGQQQIDMKRSLEGFDERFVKEATRLDSRIKEASKILVNHVSPSTFYAFLSEHTLETVSFSKFSLQDTKDGSLKLSGEGQALRYQSVVLQSDEFGRSGFLRNVLFSNLKQETPSQPVSFSFEALLDPRIILYRDKENVLTTQN